MTQPTPTARRESVAYNYDKLNWEFIKCMAEIANYAESKYGRAENYTDSRLVSDKSPMNHIIEHYRQYMAGEFHDKFGDPIYHLPVIAYNAMMEFYYHRLYGHIKSPFVDVEPADTTTRMLAAAGIQLPLPL